MLCALSVRRVWGGSRQRLWISLPEADAQCLGRRYGLTVHMGVLDTAGPESTLQWLVVALLGSGSLQPSTTVTELALRAALLPLTHSRLWGDCANLP